LNHAREEAGRLAHASAMIPKPVRVNQPKSGTPQAVTVDSAEIIRSASS
jgi:hypothetical protein